MAEGKALELVKGNFLLNVNMIIEEWDFESVRQSAFWMLYRLRDVKMRC